MGKALRCFGNEARREAACAACPRGNRFEITPQRFRSLIIAVAPRASYTLWLAITNSLDQLIANINYSTPPGGRNTGQAG